MQEINILLMCYLIILFIFTCISYTFKIYYKVLIKKLLKNNLLDSNFEKKYKLFNNVDFGMWLIRIISLIILVLLYFATIIMVLCINRVQELNLDKYDLITYILITFLTFWNIIDTSISGELKNKNVNIQKFSELTNELKTIQIIGQFDANKITQSIIKKVNHLNLKDGTTLVNKCKYYEFIFFMLNIINNDKLLTSTIVINNTKLNLKQFSNYLTRKLDEIIEQNL